MFGRTTTMSAIKRNNNNKKYSTQDHSTDKIREAKSLQAKLHCTALHCIDFSLPFFLFLPFQLYRETKREFSIRYSVPINHISSAWRTRKNKSSKKHTSLLPTESNKTTNNLYILAQFYTNNDVFSANLYQQVMPNHEHGRNGFWEYFFVDGWSRNLSTRVHKCNYFLQNDDNDDNGTDTPASKKVMSECWSNLPTTTNTRFYTIEWRFLHIVSGHINLHVASTFDLDRIERFDAIQQIQQQQRMRNTRK